ncbi:hypothetical protein Tco_0381378 [Tanacetum coccineum]
MGRRYGKNPTLYLGFVWAGKMEFGKIIKDGCEERSAVQVLKGDFKRLRRKDIEDMLLLLVQEHVEDLQLAVESYQKKINLTKPDTYRTDLRKMTPYTAYCDIQGIIYQDDIDINCLMRTDELHKFNNSTLNHVRTSLNDIATGIQIEYLPKRKWTKQDKQIARVMIKAIDKKLKYRRLM